MCHFQGTSMSESKQFLLGNATVLQWLWNSAKLVTRDNKKKSLTDELACVSNILVPNSIGCFPQQCRECKRESVALNFGTSAACSKKHLMGWKWQLIGAPLWIACAHWRRAPSAGSTRQILQGGRHGCTVCCVSKVRRLFPLPQRRKRGEALDLPVELRCYGVRGSHKTMFYFQRDKFVQRGCGKKCNPSHCFFSCLLWESKTLEPWSQDTFTQVRVHPKSSPLRSHFWAEQVNAIAAVRVFVSLCVCVS